MIRKIKSYFTLKFRYSAFIDVVSGKMVNVYADCFGDLWLKDSRWSLFRVKKSGSITAKLTGGVAVWWRELSHWEVVRCKM